MTVGLPEPSHSRWSLRPPTSTIASTGPALLRSSVPGSSSEPEQPPTTRQQIRAAVTRLIGMLRSSQRDASLVLGLRVLVVLAQPVDAPVGQQLGVLARHLPSRGAGG